MAKKPKPLGYLAEVEMRTILTALSAHNGIRTTTAKFLGISLRGLTVKLEVYASLGYRVPESTYNHSLKGPLLHKKDK